MTKRAILYARVSTDNQADNYSLPTQLEACRKYANQHGFEVIAEITDEISGSTPVNERPGGRQVYDLLNQRMAEVVVMFTIDRTARDKREYPLEFLVFLSDVQDAGAELHFTDTGRSDGGILDLFKAWQAAEERRKIRERTMRGKLAKAKAGKWVGFPLYPYGYKKIGKKRDCRLIIDDAEAATVRQIFEWYCGETRVSMAEITRRLDAAGVSRPKGGAMWYPGTIRTILTNKNYIGLFYYKDIEIPFPELAIIEPELYELAQMRLQENKRMSKRNRKHEYLLSGRARCECGVSVCGACIKTDGKEYMYYYCTSKVHGLECTHTQRYIDAHKIDSVVWVYIQGLTENPQALSEGIDEMNRQRESSIEPKRRRLNTVKADFGRTEHKMQRLISELGDEESNTIRELTKAELKRLAQAHDTLKAETDRLIREIEERSFTQADKEAIQATVDKIKHRIDGATFEQKRQVLDFFDVRVKLVEKEAGMFIRVECSLAVESADLSIEYDKCSYSAY